MTKKEFVAYVREKAGLNEYPEDNDIANRFTKENQAKYEEYLDNHHEKQDFIFVYRLMH